DPEITRGIRETIVEEPEVYGAFDLLLHNYGPETLVGSVQIEVADYMTANKIDELTRRIQQKVFDKHGIIMEGIGIYSYNTTDSNVNEIRHKILEILNAERNVMQMHGFYVDKENKTIRFDLVISFDEDDRDALCERVRARIKRKIPDYEICITKDFDISD
nr:cation transporter [Lachnospiraceae bacterium]